MSKDAFAGVYTEMLNDESFRDTVAQRPEVLGDWDLSDEEKAVLAEEATSDVVGFSMGAGAAMGYLGRGGAPLSPSIASGLGGALNKAAGLPIGALNGPGFLSNAACCPWGHAVIAPGIANQ